MESYITASEAAILLGLSQRRISRLCQQGRLGQKIGRNYAITREQIEEFQRLHRVPGNPAWRKSE
jgi:excisionase family DNA binding protein